MRSRALIGVMLATVAVAEPVIANDRYDPRLRFRTLATRHFDIHFHQGEENLAHLLGGTAEQVAKEMEPRLGRPQGRVQVILVHQADLSNGWATPVPYNLIEIVAATPRSDSIIGNTSDWLRLVFTHEYTHVLHLERSRGWFSSARRVFGRVPILFPNLFLPPQMIEGIATYTESAVTREGRIPAGDFRLVKDRAAGARRFPSLADASNARVEWPSGHTQYVYGGYFHEYLARTYGEQSLERLADETSGRIPYLGVRAFRQVYGKSLGELWTQFQQASSPPPSVTSASKRLTHHGFTVSSPWFSSDGRLFYSISNPHGFPALMEMTSAGPRRVTTKAGGGRLGGNAREIVFDQVDYVRSVAVQSDLYAVDAKTGAVRRLTKHARASDPHLSPDGSTIVCVVESDEGRRLATMRFEPPSSYKVATARLEGGFYDYASPRWSPDGQLIAAEFSALDRPASIVLVDAKSVRFVRTVAAFADGRSAGPAWSPDGRTLYYAAARQNAPFQIYAYDLVDSSTRVLRNAGISAQSPVISPDGKTLVFVGYTEDGYDLFSISLSDAGWEPVERHVAVPEPTGPPPPPRPVAEPLPTTTYSPLGTLRPRFWAPVIEPDDDELSIGAGTGGFDALGRHYYLGNLTWSTRARPDWTAYYAYDRWRPTLFADVSDDTDPWRDGQLRVVEANAGAFLRLRTVRRSQLFYGALHSASEAFDCPACPTPVDVTIDRRAVRAAWTIDTSRRYGYSVSDEYGVLFSASSEWTRKALGSTGDAGAAIGDGRAYLAFGPRHAALALRGAVASAWGDTSVRRVFAAGGSGAQPGGIAFDFDAIALIRGFDTSDVSGRRAAVLNADYRFPIRWLERGIGTWPLFARSLHGAIFTDVGAAWNSQLSRSDRRASFGGELSADIVVGYAIPLTVTAGAAWRDDPTGQSDGAALFIRLGRAF